MFGAKLVVWLVLGIGLAYGSGYYLNNNVEARNEAAFRQFDDDAAPQKVRMDHWTRNQVYGGAVAAWGVLGILFFWGDISRLMNGPSYPNRRDDDLDRPMGTRRRR